MNSTMLFRITAVVLLLFAAGHTFGFLSFRPSSAAGMAVFDAMNAVHFEYKGGKYSYAGFYTGFGLMVTAYMLFSAYLAWHLGTVAAFQPRSVLTLTWVFAAVQLACFVLSVVYFFVVPALLSGVIVICLVWAAWLLRSVRV